MNIFLEIKLALELRKLMAETKEGMVKHWRTTLLGLGTGLLMGAESYLRQHGVTVAGFLQFILPTLLGAVAADAKNTVTK